MLDSLLTVPVPDHPKSLLRGIFDNLKADNDRQEDITEGSILTEMIPEENIVTAEFQVLNQTQSFDGPKHFHEQTARFLQIPKFIEAILALLISGLLLAACLLIIRKTKAWCVNRSKRVKDEEIAVVETNCKKDAHAPVPAPIPLPSTSKEEKASTELPGEANEEVATKTDVPSVSTDAPSGSYSRQSSGASGFSSRSSSRKSCKLKDGAPRPVFVRRTSGPFGDEAMAHVEETYRRVQPYEDKQSSWARRVSTRRGPSPNPPKERENP